MNREPKHVRDLQRQGGREGARRRWGSHVPQTVRMGDLSSEQRRLVVALIEAARASRAEAASATIETAETAETEGHGNDRPTD